MTECAVEAKTFTDPEKVGKMEAEEVQEDFFDLYDLNEDGGILWSEYAFVNSFNKKSSERSREVFTFLDKVKDWRITHKEFAKAKLARLVDTDNKPKRKRR
jgi:Ca2+-binding EF-hand superfamily protein